MTSDDYCEHGPGYCFVECDCGRGSYCSNDYSSCYECFLDRKADFAECIFCGKWHSPEFDTCFNCRPQGRDEAARNLKLVIIARDGHACRYCGIRSGDQQTDPRRIAAADDGIIPAVLHVDHIRPCRRGGTADPWNLQALCGVCNIAKGADWAPGSRHDKARRLVMAAYLTYLWQFLTEDQREDLSCDAHLLNLNYAEAAELVKADYVRRVKSARTRRCAYAPA